uniref:Cytochrome P450 n=1 Tax=Dendroctonus ponderosae TaxID=77166 RepID=A0AAR5PAE4_DENPD
FRYYCIFEFLPNILGSGTVSSNMSFLMYEMARHPDIQEKTRREIWEVCKYDPEYKVTYEDLHNLKYCDMIINETLRIHTSVTEVRRMCTTDYQVPGTNVTIQKGTFVLIPIWALHNDPDYYENPKEFNPENFGEEKKADRKNAPFFPFGEGIRSCIGMRFALIQMKLAMVKYLKHFKYELNSKTPKDIQYEASPVAIEPKGNVLFDIKKVDIENYI